ncbi:hypothetical protein H4R99_001794 [Coemansia sp. RSA 1722]|nr:hypothetical protein LPJ57_000866 [Coemansia sp. RSA 486]KAJ2235584.1 hypothetical protein IWW45_002479 [Coemansia sp. RSA 485]KAJ2604476.1 hypothetical protein H4R99_001794 [Coemansia sp. RSA 1722]KAJ2637950.1 hypothetical protein GGF40_001999 [Coemansia sp. RSA 1286]
MNIDEFRTKGKQVVDDICDYYQDLDQVPPMSQVKPGYLYKLLPHEAPLEPEPFEQVQKDLQTKIMPGITHWQSGNFFGWYPSSGSFPSMIGDMYSNMLNIVGFNWICSPAVTELETMMTDWLGKLVGLDACFLSIQEDGSEGMGGGSIQGSASEAIVVAMVAAREKKLAELIEANPEMTADDVDAIRPKMVAYLSDQTHSSGQKSANIIGCKTHIVASDSNCRLTGDALRAAVANDRLRGLVPFFVCGSFGTTNTAAIDDLPGIANVAGTFGLWYHVDAAYSGSALACPEFRPLAAGAECADSFNFNTHKWMLISFECSVMWVRDSTHLVNALSIEREYLPRVKGDKTFVKDYRNWGLPLGRRFCALKLWFMMRMYGVSGIQKNIRQHVKDAKWLEDQLLADGRFEIMAPVNFGLVVFRIKPSAITNYPDVSVSECLVNKANVDLVQAIHKDNRVFLVGTVIKGKNVLRAAIGSTLGSHENTELLLEVLRRLTTDILCD